MSETVFSTQWFDVCFDEGYYKIVSSDGVAILAITEDKEVVLVKQFRPAISVYTLEVPAGALGNKDSDTTCIDELYEETGYQCDNIQFLGAGYVAANRLTSRCYYYYAPGVYRDPHWQAKEDIEVVLVPVAGFREFVLNGELTQPVSLALMYLATIRGLL